MSHLDITSQASLILYIQNAVKANTTPALLEALDSCLDAEARLRELFAQTPDHPSLQDMYIGLIRILRAPKELRMSRPRTISSEADRSAASVLPLAQEFRRPAGTPCIVDSIGEFRKNLSAITEGSLSQLFPCKNVVVAGGAVQICLTPLPEDVKGSITRIRQYYAEQYPRADINLYMWGLTVGQAIRKIRSICHAVEKSIPSFVIQYSTRKFELNIIAPFPYRRIRIFLALFQSASEVVSFLDMDCSACLYDGDDVYMSSRAVFATIRQANTIDMSRRSQNYEFNFANYANRYFEVHVPNLKRCQINPDIYKKRLQDADGFLLLLLLEKARLTGSKLLDLPFDPRKYTPTYQGKVAFSRRTENVEELLDDIGFWVLARNTQTPRLDPEALADWQKGVYVSSRVRFLEAIMAHERDTFHSILSSENIDINQMDSQGLTPLHLAIITKSNDIAFDLIDMGAKITRRLRDGRNALSIAAQLNMPEVIRKLVEQSELNVRLWLTKQRGDQTDGRLSDDDSAELESVYGDVGEEMEHAEGDILGIDLPDTETGFTPLCVALVFGCMESVEELIKAGANVDYVTYGSETSLQSVEICDFNYNLSNNVTGAANKLVGKSLIVDSWRCRGYYLPRLE